MSNSELLQDISTRGCLIIHLNDQLQHRYSAMQHKMSYIFQQAKDFDLGTQILIPTIHIIVHLFKTLIMNFQ